MMLFLTTISQRRQPGGWQSARKCETQLDQFHIHTSRDQMPSLLLRGWRGMVARVTFYEDLRIAPGRYDECYGAKRK
jgi:hypothetical protein